jgi:hypothetical protein
MALLGHPAVTEVRTRNHIVYATPAHAARFGVCYTSPRASREPGFAPGLPPGSHLGTKAVHGEEGLTRLGENR